MVFISSTASVPSFKRQWSISDTVSTEKGSTQPPRRLKTSRWHQGLNISNNWDLYLVLCNIMGDLFQTWPRYCIPWMCAPKGHQMEVGGREWTGICSNQRDAGFSHNNFGSLWPYTPTSPGKDASANGVQALISHVYPDGSQPPKFNNQHDERYLKGYRRKQRHHSSHQSWTVEKQPSPNLESLQQQQSHVSKHVLWWPYHINTATLYVQVHVIVGKLQGVSSTHTTVLSTIQYLPGPDAHIFTLS